MRGTSRRVSSRKFWLTSAIGAVAALAAAGMVFAEEGEGKKKDEVFKLKQTVTIGGVPLVAFDISWVSDKLHSYYLADRSNNAVDVIDTKTKGLRQFQKGSFLGNTGNNNTSGPDGVLTFDDQLWVGDGKSRVWVLNAKTGALWDTKGAPNPIPTSSGPTIFIPNNPNRADEICYDKDDGLVMAANNADTPPFATIISTKTYTVKAQIAFPTATNGAEQCQWDPRTKKFYISIPEINGPGDNTAPGGVAVIDPGSLSVEKIFNLDHAKCAGPQGMAIGPDRQILLGCNGSSTASNPPVYNTVIIDDITGVVIKTLRNQGGNDEVWYNPGDGHYFLAEGQQAPLGALFATTAYTELLGVVDSAFKRPDKAAKTGTNCGTTRRAHSVAADPDANQAYVPIPADTGTAGTCTFFEGGLCPNPALGCVAIFSPVGKDDHGHNDHGDNDHGDNDHGDDNHHGDNNHGDDRQE